MSKTMIVPVESVEKAIEGARVLISNLQNIQKSRVVVMANSQDPMNEVSELLARRVERGERLEDVIGGAEKDVIIKLIEKGHDDNVKLSRVLGISPENARQKLFTRGIRLKEVKKMLAGEGVVVKNEA